MLLIHLLNNFQQQCLLRQMDRLLENTLMLLTHFSSIMFAKKNKRYQHPDAFNTFIE